MATKNRIRIGLWLLGLVPWLLIGVAAIALGTAASVVILPHEQAYLQATVPELYRGHHDGSLVGYIIHNRVSFAGALLVTGGFYLWLVHRPIKDGSPWAWWALMFSGLLGSASILNYRTHHYLDSWHAFGTASIALTLVLGLAFSYPGLKRPKSLWALLPTNLYHELLSFPKWTAFFIGRIWLSVWAIGTILGGVFISLTGMFPIFVPQDLEFMQTTLGALEQVNHRLIPFIAHDRIGFGGALFSWGIAALAVIWHGLKPGRLRLVYLMSLLWLVELITAVLIHPVVGYNSLSHLAPFLIKDGFFLIGIVFIYPEIVEVTVENLQSQIRLSNR